MSEENVVESDEQAETPDPDASPDSGGRDAEQDRDCQDRIRKRIQNENEGVISILNSVAPALKREMDASGIPMVAILVASRNGENRGIFEVSGRLDEVEEISARVSILSLAAKYWASQAEKVKFAVDRLRCRSGEEGGEE